jgi:thioredoxin-related protein
MQRIFTAFLCTIIWPYTISAQKTIDLAHTGYDQFIAVAKQTNKPVMIYFTGTGCSLCVEMEKQVFTKPEVYELYNKSFVNIESFDDAEKPDPATKALRKKYGIVSNPTFIFIDTEGNVIHKSGYRKNGKEFSWVGQQALGADNYRAWLQKIETGNFDRITLENFLSVEQKPFIYAESGYQCKSQKALDTYFSFIPENEYTAKENWPIIEQYVFNPYSKIFTHLIDNQEEYKSAFGDKVVTKKIYTVLDMAWSGNTGGDAYRNAEKFIRSSNSPVATLLIRMKEMRLEREKVEREKTSWHPFIDQYDSFISNYAYLDRPIQLYHASKDICNRFPANKSLVAVANKWIGSAIAIESDDADYYAVYAQTFFLLGDKRSALVNQEKAIRMATEQNADKEDLDLLKKGLSLYQK